MSSEESDTDSEWSFHSCRNEVSYVDSKESLIRQSSYTALNEENIISSSKETLPSKLTRIDKNLTSSSSFHSPRKEFIKPITEKVSEFLFRLSSLNFYGKKEATPASSLQFKSSLVNSITKTDSREKENLFMNKNTDVDSNADEYLFGISTLAISSTSSSTVDCSFKEEFDTDSAGAEHLPSVKDDLPENKKKFADAISLNGISTSYFTSENNGVVQRYLNSFSFISLNVKYVCFVCFMAFYAYDT